jgi:DNA-binding NarL/FixJ family response regulator
MVDNHGIMRDGIRALLGVHDDIEIVGEAFDGKGAVKRAIELRPDVIIMGIAMPGMDGLEATRRIKKKLPKIKVLFLTKYEDSEHVLSAIKAGTDGYIPKRAASSELRSAIRTVREGNIYLSPSATEVLFLEYQKRVAKEEPYDQLTARQREILKLIAEGHTGRDIAAMLSINLKTVLVHRENIMRKLDLHNHIELIKYAGQP